MAHQWFYGRDGKQEGPVSSEELKALASNGTLHADDLVWHSGQTEWQPARRVKGLFPQQSQSVPPPVPEASVANRPIQTKGRESSGFLDTLKQSASHLAANSKAAAHLAAKQTEREKISRFSLPKAYRNLGEAIHSARSFGEEFATDFGAIDELLAQMQKLKRDAPVVPEAKLSKKGKAIAVQVRNAVSAKALSLKVDDHFRHIGNDAYKSHGEKAAPRELVEPIARHQARLNELGAEIKAIEDEHAGHWLTPRRIALAGACGVGVFVLLGVLSIFSGIGRTTATITHDGGDTQIVMPDLPRSQIHVWDEDNPPTIRGASDSPMPADDVSTIDFTHGPNGEPIELWQESRKDGTLRDRRYLYRDVKSDELVPHGPRTSFYPPPDGRTEPHRMYEELYVFGTLKCYSRWDHEGRIETQGVYLGDANHWEGKYAYDEDGHIKEKASFKVKHVFENERERQTKMPHGPQERYFTFNPHLPSSGGLAARYIWHNGALVGHITYDSDGHLQNQEGDLSVPNDWYPLW